MVFSFLGGFLMVGILVAFLAGIAALDWCSRLTPALSLAVSAMFILLMSGFILYQTSQLVHEPNTNYILATRCGGEPERPEIGHEATSEEGHGRIEHRSYFLSTDLTSRSTTCSRPCCTSSDLRGRGLSRIGSKLHQDKYPGSSRGSSRGFFLGLDTPLLLQGSGFRPPAHRNPAGRVTRRPGSPSCRPCTARAPPAPGSSRPPAGTPPPPQSGRVRWPPPTR